MFSRSVCSERGYEQLNKEYNELIEFSNMEKEVYSCRTPGQVKEVRILGVCQLSNQYKFSVIRPIWENDTN